MGKWILIPDSFKGTMSSEEICAVMAAALRRHLPEADIVSVPVADGGEGSVDAFLTALGGRREEVPCTGPDGRPITAFYGRLPDGTAVVEMAAAAGLPLMEGHLCAEGATTYGVGELLRAAVHAGAKRVILGLGGSATNDGGCGCAAALGIRFLDRDGVPFVPVGGTLDRLDRIDASGLDPVVRAADITVMCDIDNPLCGPNGASAVFGPQKGAGPEMVARLDGNLGHLADIISFILTWLVLKRWCEKEFIPAVPEVTAEIEETNSDKVDDLLIKSEDLPGTFAAFLTILIPVILIAGSSFAGMFISDSTPDDALIRTVVAIFGDKVVALSMGVIYTMFLAMFHKKSVRKSNTDSTGKDPESFREVVLNSWVARGLEVALAALLITGMGGGFSQVIKSFPNINDLATLIQNSGVPGLLIPFLVGAIMMTAVGSMTTAGITAVGVVAPMMDMLGLEPVSTTLAIGAGTLIFNHVTNSGFWVVSKFFNLDMKQGLKYITIPDAVAGVFGFVIVFILSSVGLIH